jgi:hypothetical protein
METHEQVIHFINRLVLDSRLKPTHISFPTQPLSEIEQYA